MVMAMTDRRGYTLIEVVVVVAVLTILATLVAGGLVATRDKARALACQASIRSVASGVAQYAVQFQDAVPLIVSPARVGTGDWRVDARYYVQGSRVFTSVLWDTWTDHLARTGTATCPSNPTRPPYAGDRLWFDYAISLACYLNPLWLDPAAKPAALRAMRVAQPQRFGSVVFPAGKAMLYEELVWHGWRGGVPARGTSYFNLKYESGPVPGNVAFFDGHVVPVRVRQASYVYRAALPFGEFDLTPHGVRGCDVRN